MFIYEGDLKDEETVLEFLTDDDNFSMGDKIEEVDAENLINIIETDPYVSVFFYDDTKESSKALEHMEDIDDETDVFNIRYIFVILLFQVVIFRFLRINDPELADDYSLKKIPCLVFFRWDMNSATNREISSQLLLLSLQEWDSCGLRRRAQGRARDVGMVG